MLGNVILGTLVYFFWKNYYLILAKIYALFSSPKNIINFLTDYQFKGEQIR